LMTMESKLKTRAVAKILAEKNRKIANKTVKMSLI